MITRSSLLAMAIALCSSPSFAQEVAPVDAAPPTTDTAADTDSAETGDDATIVVTGHRRRVDDVLGDVQVLSGDDLAATVRPTIGATLASMPGVTSTGSGPNVSKPVLRGLSGDRIRTLVDGIGSLDVSASSSDHAVAINPLTAQSIEVLHGPASLVFGSSAVGGVVNVIDSRIPRAEPADGYKVKGLLGYGTAANERLASGAIDVGLGSHFVAHGDVSWTKNDDLRIGGHVLAKPLRDQATASADPEVQALADLKDNLPNSDGRSFEAAGALAYVDGDLNIGASITRRTANYGVPVRFSLDPSVEAEQTHIDVRQTRYDARVEVPLGGFLRKVRLRGGYSDYRHDEVEDTGEIGSSVFSKGGEVRLDLDQRDTPGGWGGASGIQYFNVRQHIEGEELYLPPVKQESVGLFTVQHLDSGPLRLEAGARFEHSKASAEANAVIGNPDLSRSFSTLSLSAGGRYNLARDWSLGLNLTRSQRAPSAEELYANGPHGGNASFEVGNRNLKTERSIGVEATLKHSSDAFNGSLTFYASRYASFIYQAPTGVIEDDLPVYETRQGRARYRGFEAEAHVPLGTAGGVQWEWEGTADATWATIRGFGPAPLIPPLRVQSGLNGKVGAFDGRVEVEHAWKQDRTAPFELDTPGYTLVNASLNWKPFDRRPDLTLGLAANNIFDVNVRHATSLLKDYAPAAGRDLRLTLNFAY